MKLSQEQSLLILKMLTRAIDELESKKNELTFFQAQKKKNISFRIEAIHQIGDQFDSKLNIDLSKLSKIDTTNVLIILTTYSEKYNNPEDEDMYLSVLKTINTIKTYIGEPVTTPVIEKIEQSNIERMQPLAEDIIDAIISSDKKSKIYENYEEFIKVFENFSSFRKYEQAATVVIDRDEISYKIYIVKEENSFSAHWNLLQ